MTLNAEKSKTKELAEAPVKFQDVMAVLKLSPPTLRALIKAGKIRSHSIGQRKSFYFLSEVFEDIKKL